MTKKHASLDNHGYFMISIYLSNAAWEIQQISHFWVLPSFIFLKEGREVDVSQKRKKMYGSENSCIIFSYHND